MREPELAGNLVDVQAEEIFDLRAGDQDRDAVGESETTGRGMNFTAEPMPVTPMMTSSTPAITVHMNRPSTPWSGDDAGDDHDEGAGRAADLRLRSAER